MFVFIVNPEVRTRLIHSHSSYTIHIGLKILRAKKGSASRLVIIMVNIGLYDLVTLIYTQNTISQEKIYVLHG